MEKKGKQRMGYSVMYPDSSDSRKRLELGVREEELE